MKQIWNKIKSFFASLLDRFKSGEEKDFEYSGFLTEEDFLDLGFDKIDENTKYKDFVKGNLTLKWGYRPSMRTLSIRWGKSPRFFGVCETKGDLVYLLILIEKYFKK
jgi:hypothetical protein